MITDLQLIPTPLAIFSNEIVSSDFSMDDPMEDNDEEDSDDELMDDESELDSDDDMVSDEDY